VFLFDYTTSPEALRYYLHQLHVNSFSWKTQFFHKTFVITRIKPNWNLSNSASAVYQLGATPQNDNIRFIHNQSLTTCSKIHFEVDSLMLNAFRTQQSIQDAHLEVFIARTTI